MQDVVNIKSVQEKVIHKAIIWTFIVVVECDLVILGIDRYFVNIYISNGPLPWSDKVRLRVSTTYSVLYTIERQEAGS